eukprot:2881567-Rhodomonas_salina.2
MKPRMHSPFPVALRLQVLGPADACECRASQISRIQKSELTRAWTESPTMMVGSAIVHLMSTKPRSKKCEYDDGCRKIPPRDH